MHNLILTNRNHWHTEQTGLGDISEPLWDYMTNTWVPRGTETAYLLYDAPGWVGFSNLNTFGFTGYEFDL
jgi:alpha-L-fucosidase 2